VTRYDELRPVLAGRLVTRPRAAWLEALTAAGVPCGSVRSVGEVLDDPQLAARDMIARLEHTAAGAIRALGVPIKLSETPGVVRTPPPQLGEHTDAVLDELGFGVDDIARLRTTGTV
jgi:crotonobetainyl-CoA:carnitine CoA-transferase CaiB-like acyl-CoA transferase